jgi:sterol 14-demethylase
VSSSHLQIDSELTDSEMLYDEQKKMFGNSDGTFRSITYEDTKEMPVMDSVIRETLRMVSLASPAY